MCYRSKITISEGVTYVYKTANSCSNANKYNSVQGTQTINKEDCIKTSQMHADKDITATNVVQNGNPSLIISIHRSNQNTDNIADNHKVMIRGPEIFNLKSKGNQNKRKKNRKMKIFDNNSKEDSKFEFKSKEFKSKVKSIFKKTEVKKYNEEVKYNSQSSKASSIEFASPIKAELFGGKLQNLNSKKLNLSSDKASPGSRTISV